jgi:dihydroorotate dehydrogenase
MWPLLRRILFLVPAEEAHSLAKVALRALALFLPRPEWIEGNPVGLAAGFDKNAELLDILPRFGFGHAEIGTVTPRPQGGNERPRLFRDPSTRRLFNRMGFNNLGAGIIAARVARAKPKLPRGFLVGVNLGKNKNTPEELAAEDYAQAARAFLDTADYFVVNVSSPNTPGLRALQTPEALLPILTRVKNEVADADRPIPIYVKLAPELSGETLRTLLRAIEEAKGADGFILTNTEAGVYIYEGAPLSGGFSGQNLTPISRERLLEARGMTSLPLISVGGIMTEEEAVARMKAGASAIQVYSGWIYGGPFFARRLRNAIRASR